MKPCTVVRAIAAGLAIASAPSFAQQQEIIVESPRVQATRLPTHVGDLPVEVITVSHVMSYSNIDISTSSGAKVLEQRIEDAAKAACQDIDKLYPTPMRPPVNATPSCEKAATDAAMIRAKAAIAAAEKAAHK